MIIYQCCLFRDWPLDAESESVEGKDVRISPEAKLKPKCFTSDLNYSRGFLLLNFSLPTGSQLPGLVKPV